MTVLPCQSPADSEPETIAGMAISLVFWICLFISAALFSLVALSPKLLTYLELHSQYASTQFQLLGLERQTKQLQRVIDAIRGDKDFAAELTRIELDVVRPDEEVIPVETSLKLQTRTPEESRADNPDSEVWYQPTVKCFATDKDIRAAFLISAGVLVVISFTVLQPAVAKRSRSSQSGRNSIWRSLHRRYARPV